jgi:hypothetical protein
MGAGVLDIHGWGLLVDTAVHHAPLVYESMIVVVELHIPDSGSLVVPTFYHTPVLGSLPKMKLSVRH